MTTVVEVALRQWAEEQAARRRSNVTFLVPRAASGILALIMAGLDYGEEVDEPDGA